MKYLIISEHHNLKELEKFIKLNL